MAVLMYENPVTIKEDPDTGLLLLVDGNGKTLARAATPGDLVQLGSNKGVYSGDLPAAVDPRGSPQQAAEVQNTVAAEKSAAGQTAEQKVTNDTPVATAGAGQNNQSSSPTATPASTPLTDNETKKLSAQNSSQVNTTLAQETANSQIGQSYGTIAEPSSAADVANGKATKDVNSAQAIPASALKNRLHDFTSYTYRITLYLLTSDDYRAVNAKPYDFVPKYILIRSGGAGPLATDKTPGKHPDFQEDFYFENLNITTVVGLNSRSKASNAVNIKFDIIEPYGMTLLDRFLSACMTTADCPNYVDQPYLLQIDFIANPDQVDQFGAKGVLIDTKRIPIKLTEFKIKPGINGTTYHVRAMPYNHSAFLESAAAVPVNMSVEATTVQDYFDSQSFLAQLFDEQAAKQEERIEEALKKFNDPMLTAEELERERARLKAEFIYTTKSFPAAYNTYFKNAAYSEGRYEQPLYQIAFNIHPDIGKSKIVDPAKTNSTSSTMTSRLENYVNTGSSSSAANPDFKNKSVFNISYGTDIVNLIDRVVSSSEYVKNQVRKYDEEQEKSKQQDTNNNTTNARASTDKENKTTEQKAPVKWFKIIPNVTLGNYDKKSKGYSKTIIFSILPYDAANSYHPDFKFTSLSTNQCVRTYQYYYTGKNQDVIGLDIDFDATFITGITTFTNKLERTNNYAGADVVDVGDDNKTVSDQRPPQWLPFRTGPTPADTQLSSGKPRTAEDYAVASVARSLYSSYPRGDMLNIRIKIVGDPAFIKQDDVYHNPMQSSYATAINATRTPGTPPVNVDANQIIFDAEQVYVQLIVKGAVDIDDTTGITNKTLVLSNGQTTNGSFSGIYKVQMVSSDFSKGKFEQTLDLIRMPDDLTDVQTKVKTEETTKPAIQEATTNTVAVAQGTDRFAGQAKTDAQTGQNNLGVVDPKLKEIAQGPATNTSSTTPGAGRPAQADQPTAAAPINVNDAKPETQPQATPTQPPAEEDTNAKVKEINAQIDALSDQRLAKVRPFNAALTELNANTSISAEERNQQELKLREEFMAFIVSLGTPLLSLANQTAAFRPITDSSIAAQNRINRALNILVNDKKVAEARIAAIKKELGTS